MDGSERLTLITFKSEGQYAACIAELMDREPPVTGFGSAPAAAKAELYKVVAGPFLSAGLRDIEKPAQSLRTRLQAILLRVKPSTEVEAVTLDELIARAEAPQ